MKIARHHDSAGGVSDRAEQPDESVCRIEGDGVTIEIEPVGQPTNPVALEPALHA